MPTKKRKNYPAPQHPMEKVLPRKSVHEFSWRIFRIMAEFVEGFEFLSQFKKEVTVFGSARLDPKNRWYKEAKKFGGMLAKSGFTVITGGGGGIMEAANRGAKAVDPSKSIGLNIQLPQEQRMNEYVTKGKGFYYFFTRKVMLSFSAQTYVYFPGGFGTMDEFFEIVTLVQTKKAVKVPIVCVGKDFWNPLLKFVSDKLVDEYKTANAEDMKLFTVVNSAEEALALVKKSKDRKLF